MPTLDKILKADAAGPEMRKIYERSNYALAGLTPIAVLGGEGSTLIRLTDLALGVAIPVHAHIGINGVISDYVPPRFMGASRWAALGASVVTLIGLTKLNLEGPGITSTVKRLWHSEKAEKQ